MFVFVNSAQPDEIPHYVAFRQDLYCLLNTHLGIPYLQRAW